MTALESGLHLADSNSERAKVDNCHFKPSTMTSQAVKPRTKVNQRHQSLKKRLTFGTGVRDECSSR